MTRITRTDEKLIIDIVIGEVTQQVVIKAPILLSYYEGLTDDEVMKRHKLRSRIRTLIKNGIGEENYEKFYRECEWDPVAGAPLVSFLSA